MDRERWLAVLVLACTIASCRFGYDEDPPFGAGTGGGFSPGSQGGTAGVGATGGTASVGDAGEVGAAGEIATGAAGGVGGGGSGVGGLDTAGGTGGSNAGNGGRAGAGGPGTAGAGGGGGVGGEVGGSSGSAGTGAGGMAGTAGAGGGSAGAAAAAGWSGTPPDSTLCIQGTYGGHDYLLCEEVRPWHDANGGCVAIGMRLVRVDDANENQWLFDNAIVRGALDSQVWLGAWDEPVEGEWHWTDGDLFWIGDEVGTAQNGLFNGWYWREPNDVDLPFDNDCAALDMGSSDPDWYDEPCEHTKAYVCESL